MFINHEAKTIKLRLAECADAEFINDLRVSEKYNKHLSKVSGDVEQQREWLSSYKIRENEGREYYFIILRKSDSLRIGTVRLYDFLDDKKSFCWGSWILNEDKTNSSAIESALLVYKIAFEELGFERSHFDVRKDNLKVVDFHLKLGASMVNESELDYFFIYEKEVFNKFSVKYKKFMSD